MLSLKKSLTEHPALPEDAQAHAHAQEEAQAQEDAHEEAHEERGLELRLPPEPDPRCLLPEERLTGTLTTFT